MSARLMPPVPKDTELWLRENALGRVLLARRFGDVAYLVEALGDPDRYAQASAARTLGRLKESDGVIPLLQLLEASTDEIVRASCIRALERIGDERAIPAIKHAAVERGPFGVRAAAVAALLALGDRSAIPVLTSIVLDRQLERTYAGLSSLPDFSVRRAKRWASKELVRSRASEAVPALEEGIPSLDAYEKLRVRLLIARLRRRKRGQSAR